MSSSAHVATNNHTGFAQVLEEGVDSNVYIPADGRLQSNEISLAYALGHDVIEQGAGSGVTSRFYLYDGHGSTRGLLNFAASVLQRYAYDAYGNQLFFGNLTPAASVSTRYLYSGERTDKATGWQNLQARYLDPQTGRFITLDPFTGLSDDPRTLHKYLYVHGDPVNFDDPSGLRAFFADLGKAAHRLISDLHRNANPGHIVTYGASIPYAAGAILPDIMDFSTGKIAEIKPLSVWGLPAGYLQLRAAIAISNGLAWDYNGKTIKVRKVRHSGPQPNWIAEDWSPGVQVLLPGTIDPAFANYVVVTLGNYNGLILYKALQVPSVDHVLQYAKEVARTAERLVAQFGLNVHGQLDPAVISALDWQFEIAISTSTMHHLLRIASIGTVLTIGAGFVIASLPALSFGL